MSEERDEQVTSESTEQKEKLTYYKALTDIANQIHSASNINDILINLKD